MTSQVVGQDDLWDAMEEYKEAKEMMLDIGKQILLKVTLLNIPEINITLLSFMIKWCFRGIKIEMPLKDNMIDEERAKKEAAGQMTFEQKVNLLNDQVNVLERSTTNYQKLQQYSMIIRTNPIRWNQIQVASLTVRFGRLIQEYDGFKVLDNVY